MGGSVRRAPRRNSDGGFGPVDGAPSEAEATAFVALAFDDPGARDWLEASQAADGSLGLMVGSVIRDVSALGALALGPGPARELAVDRVAAVAGRNGPDPEVTHFGWPWTDGAHGWSEPTAWGLLALRTLRPTATDRIADALSMFRERECVGGGWNYGSRETLGVDLRPYVQTTAVALLALGDAEPDLTQRGVSLLEQRWRSEIEGPLSVATASCALRAFGSPEAQRARDAAMAVDPAGLDTVTSAWLAFALDGTGPWSVG
jgi:hypothetical protein